MKILIIEDEILILKSLEVILKQFKHDVHTAILGKVGLEQILLHNFEIIITDLMLNDITGFDILEGAMKKYTRPEITKKFIIMSAYNSPQILKRIESYGCPFLSKPFKDIYATVKKILEDKINEN